LDGGGGGRFTNNVHDCLDDVVVGLF
jgi:hypothetical protein